MQNPKGNAIRVKNHGDGVKATIPIAELLEGQSLDALNSVTIEALIYPEKLPPQEYLAEIIKFEQSWKSQLQLVRFKWEDVLKIRLSKEILGDEGNISSALTLNSWHYIKMKIDKQRVYLTIDGVEIYNKEREETDTLFDGRDIEVYLGDFRGWVDEFRIGVGF